MSRLDFGHQGTPQMARLVPFSVCEHIRMGPAVSPVQEVPGCEATEAAVNYRKDSYGPILVHLGCIKGFGQTGDTSTDNLSRPTSIRFCTRIHAAEVLQCGCTDQKQVLACDTIKSSGRGLFLSAHFSTQELRCDDQLRLTMSGDVPEIPLFFWKIFWPNPMGSGLASCSWLLGYPN